MSDVPTVCLAFERHRVDACVHFLEGVLEGGAVRGYCEDSSAGGEEAGVGGGGGAGVEYDTV